MQNKPSVLFVCTANRFRSPIAEAVFRKILLERGFEENWIVGSAGCWTTTGLAPVPSAAWMQKHLGLDLSMHHSRAISRELIAQYDLIIVMEKGQKEALIIEYPDKSKKIFILTEFSEGPVYDIPDPICEPEETCFDVAQEINRLITNSFQEICLRAATIKDMSGDI